MKIGKTLRYVLDGCLGATAFLSSAYLSEKTIDYLADLGMLKEAKLFFVEEHTEWLYNSLSYIVPSHWTTNLDLVVFPLFLAYSFASISLVYYIDKKLKRLER